MSNDGWVVALTALLLCLMGARSEAACKTTVPVPTVPSSCGIGPQFRSRQSLTPGSADLPVMEWKCESAPTNVRSTVFRPGQGRFAAPRPRRPHTGVDIMLRDYSRMCVFDTSSSPIEFQEVYAVADGVVAYNRFNTDDCPEKRPGCDKFTTGLGHTVIVDHGNGMYSLYGHLAQDRRSRMCLPRHVLDGGGLSPVKVGDQVKAGQVVGYLGIDAENVPRQEAPSGNAAVVTESAQLHFEFFAAPSGRCSYGPIKEIVPPLQRGLIDPTPFLRSFYP